MLHVCSEAEQKAEEGGKGRAKDKMRAGTMQVRVGSLALEAIASDSGVNSKDKQLNEQKRGLPRIHPPQS